MFQGGAHKVAEEGMGPVGAALELGVELYGHEPGMIGNLDNFHQVALGVLARHAHAAGHKALQVFVVELVAVAVALLNFADEQ